LDRSPELTAKPAQYTADGREDKINEGLQIHCAGLLLLHYFGCFGGFLECCL
jgi:hypothetical protein